MVTAAPKLAVPTRYTHKQGHVSNLGPSQVPSSARITEHTGPKMGLCSTLLTLNYSFITMQKGHNEINNQKKKNTRPAPFLASANGRGKNLSIQLW